MKQFSKELGKVSITPKGDWNSSTTNERLDIVYDRRNNQAYIAKQDVPIGVDIDNREYWQPLNVSGYADNNFINLTAENENGTITAYESLEEAVATIFPINRRVGATLSFYNLNSDRLDRQAEFELWQFNSTDLANWENRDYWNNIYYNWNVFAGWYVDADALKNHVNIPNVGQYAYVGSNLNDAILYQCRTNGTWTNTGIKVRNYISVVVSGNITIGENGNWFSDGEDTGIPATPAVDEQLDIIIAKHESLSRTVQGIAVTGGASTATNVTYNNDSSRLNAENAQDAIDEVSSMVIYDVSARNNGVVFESLSALLSSSNLITLIPTSVRHGGMTIRFIQGSEQSSDNKYVQYRLMNQNWSITISDWQGIDDEPTNESENLVKSGGIAEKLFRIEKVCTFSETIKSIIINGDWKENDIIEIKVSNFSQESGQWYIHDYGTPIIWNILYGRDDGIFKVALTRDTTKIRIGITTPTGNEQISFACGMWTNVINALLKEKQNIMSAGKNIEIQNNKIINSLPFDIGEDGLKTKEPIYIEEGKSIEKKDTISKFVLKSSGSLADGGNYFYSSVYDVSGLRGTLEATATSTSNNISAIGLFKNDVCVYRTSDGTDVKKTDVVELTDALDADTLYVSYQQTNVNENPVLYKSYRVVATNDIPYTNEEGQVVFQKNIAINKIKSLEKEETISKFVSKSSGILGDGGNYYFSSVYNVSGLRGLLTATAKSNSSAISAIGLFKNNVCVYRTSEGSDTKPTDSVELTDTLDADTLYVGYIINNINADPTLVNNCKVVTEEEIKQVKTTIITATRNLADYNSIREIINSITDATKYNQYIIFIPKGEWFECDLQGKKYVKLVGEDMQETIIYNDGNSTNLTPSDYSLPSKANMRLCDIDRAYKHCFYGIHDMDVENLTINISSAKYCVHLDKEGERTAIFKNCKMENDANSLNVVGIGLWAKQDYTFIGCDFIQNNDGQDTSFYMHNWNNQKYIGKLRIEKCRMNKNFARFSELGSEASTLVYLNDCKSTMPNAKVRLSIEGNGENTFWIDPTTGQTTKDWLKVPYCIKLNYFGTNCDFIVHEKRPNALNYVMG